MHRFHRFPTLLATLFVPAALLAQPAHAATPTIAGVLRCQPQATIDTPNACPYLSEVLQGDRAFAKRFQQTLRTGKVPSLRGPESPMQPLKIGQTSYVSGDRCEAHNCGAHRYVFIFAPNSQRLAGLYQPDGGQPRWFGKPSTAEKRVLRTLFGD